MTYTDSAVLGVVIATVLDLAVVRTRLLLNKAFWTAYAIMLFFQLVVNGLLTGLGIVRYRRKQIIGLHIAYAPVEDLVFGFALILLTLTLWVRAGRSSAPRDEPSTPRAAP